MKILFILTSLVIAFNVYSKVEVAEYRGVNPVTVEWCGLYVKEINGNSLTVSFEGLENDVIFTKTSAKKMEAEMDGSKFELLFDDFGNPSDFKVMKDGEAVEECINMALAIS